MNFYIILIFLLVLFIVPLSAQVTDRMLREAGELYERGAYEEAIILLNRTLESDSLQPEAYLKLAGAYLHVHDPVRAEETADAGLRFFPDLLGLKVLKGEALLQWQNFASAITYFKRVERSLQRDTSPEAAEIPIRNIRDRIGIAYQQMATRAYMLADTADAVYAFEQALEYLPDSVSVYNNLAYLYIQTGAFQNALQTIEEGLDRFPENKNLTLLKARSLYHLEKYDELEDIYRDIVQTDPDEVMHKLVYAELLMANRKYDEAIELYYELMELHPEERSVYRSLIAYYQRHLNYPAIIEVLEITRKAFPHDVSLIREIASIHELLEDFESARAYYDTLAVVSGDLLAAGIAIADTYLLEDNVTAALATLRQLQKTYPDNLDLADRVGRLYIKKEEWHEAGSIYESLLEKSPSASVHMQLGRIYEATGSDRNAMSHFERAINRSPENPYPYFRLAVLTYEADEPGRSFELTERALSVGFRRLEQEQHGMYAGFEGEFNLADPESLRRARSQRETVEEYDRLAEEIFFFMIKNFSKEQAEPVIERLASSYIGSGKLHYLIGEFYNLHDDDRTAYVHYTEAARQSPAYRPAHLALGAYHEKNQNTRQAIHAYERALTLDPKDGKTYRALIRLYRAESTLDRLCDRWLARYRTERDNEILREHLIEALHKAGRYEDAEKIVQGN